MGRQTADRTSRGRGPFDRSWAVLFAAPVIVLVAACERGWSAGEALDAPRLEAAAVLAWTAGGLDEEGGVVLQSQPSSGALRVDGMAALVDRSARHVLLLGPGGQLVRTVGASGQGPGEFAQPRQVGFHGDSLLWVSDGMLGRITWFDLGGQVVDTWDASREAVPNSSWSVRGNWVVGGVTIVGLPSLDPSAPEDVLPPLPIVFRSEAGDVEVVDWVESPAPIGLVLRTDAGFVAGSRPQPIAGAPVIDVATGGNWLFVLDRSPARDARGTVEIRRYDASGSALETVSFTYRPHPVDEGVRQWVRSVVELSVRHAQNATSSFPERFGKLTLEAVMEAVWIPAYLPPVREALADDEGFWIQRERRYPRGEERWDTWERYDLQGRLEARVRLPWGFQGLAATRDRLLGVVRTEAVPQLQSFDIEFGSPGER